MKKTVALLLLLGVMAGANAQQLTKKLGKRDTLYTITMSKIIIVDGKPTDKFDIVNLKWADTLWHVSRDLDFTPKMSIKDYRWFFYDKNFNTTRFERYVDEKLALRTVNVFNSQNQLTERRHYTLSNGDTVLFRHDVVASNGKGQPTKIDIFDGSNKKIASETYVYDANGNELRKKAKMKALLDADSVYSRQTAYVYDSVGRIAQKTVAAVNGDKSKSKIRYEYTYNKDGKLASIAQYNSAGNMLGKEEIIYHSGRVSQRKYYNSDSVLVENLAYRYRKFGASLDHDMY